MVSHRMFGTITNSQTENGLKYFFEIIGGSVEYSKPQLEAVRHVDGPMMVLAGPGSGKTAVITGRVRCLLEEMKIAPQTILVITFTKAAATEMKERFVKLMGEPKGVQFATFHSVFFMILRVSYGYGVDQIITEEITRNFLKEKIRTLGLEEGDEKDFIKNIIGEISKVKSEGVAIENYYSLNCPEEAFRDIFRSYEAFMKERGLIDFDDMMILCNKLFSDYPHILEAWQSKFKYILIDEFQDLSSLNFELVRKMSEPINNIFIVCDDDQSIYRFRGAKPEIMLGFEKIYPNCKKVLLNENYRSTEAILNFAGSVIHKNKQRFDKKIVAAKGVEGSLPVIKSFPDRRAEDTAIVKDIIKSHEDGIPFSEMAIVYRTNVAARPVIAKLIEYNIPFIVKEMAPSIYNHFIAKNIMDYLEIANGDRSRSRFLNIMNRPNRYLSRESLSDAVTLNRDKVEYVSFIRWTDAYKGRNWMAERINTLQFQLAKLSELSPFGAIHYLRKVIGYDKFLTEYADERHIDADELFEILEEIEETAKPYGTLKEWKDSIEDFNKKQKEEFEKNKNADRDAVVISTMHGCKGLEFDKVYIPEVVEGIIPYKKAIRQSDIEEERRLFYVAITRAKKELMITYPKNMYGKDKEVSPFLREYLR